jgi:hypothetical protein
MVGVAAAYIAWSSMFVFGTVRPLLAYLRAACTVHATNIRSLTISSALLIVNTLLLVVEKPINQRIKFLLETLSLSARDFSRAVGVPDNNTQNYLEPRFAQPKADYLEKVMLHFESINPVWLLTGKGEPFSPGTTPSTTNNAHIKNNSGIGINNGTATQHITLEACQRELEIMKRDAASYQREIELLKGQLEDKNEIITLLRANNSRLN